MANLNPENRSSYPHFTPITTRWKDNDIYGHVNNVVYYSFFDSVANSFLIQQAGLDINTAPVIGFVVASDCQYRSPIAYPDVVEVGFRVNKLGNSSVEYGMGIFKQGAQQASAFGTFTHVFVDRNTHKSAQIPAPIRSALETVLVD